MTAMPTGTRKVGEFLVQTLAATVRHRSRGFHLEGASGNPGTAGQNWMRKLRRACSLLDLGFIASGTVLAAAIFPHPSAPYVGIAMAVLWFFSLRAYKSADSRVLGSGFNEYKRVFTASFVALGVVSLLSELAVQGMAHGYFVLASTVGLVTVLCGRMFLHSWLTKQRRAGRCLSRAVVVGDKEDVDHVIGKIQAKSAGPYLVIGAAVVSLQPSNAVMVDGQEVPVVSDVQSLMLLLNTYAPDAVIVAGQVPGGSKFIRDLAWDLERTGAELVLANCLTNVAPRRIHARPADSLPLFHVQLPRYTGYKLMVKRLFDVVLSGAALVMLIPVFAGLALLIRRDSPGPAIFRQERVGLGEHTFMMYKFRSMVATAEAELNDLLAQNEGAGLLFKLRNDPRVTNVGRWLRRLSLDELPQLWNVFRGDMSLVGPRPPLPSEVSEYEPAVHRRLYVKPGLTGLWQVNGRSDLSWNESVNLDLYYVENWSLAGDLLIMLRTVKVLIRPQGAY